MIRKNVKVGKLVVDTMIELGNGDVKIASLRFQDDKQVGVEFVNDISNPIGTEHQDANTTTDDSKPQVILSFSDVRAIKVVEDALDNAKIMLNKIIEDDVE